MKKEVIRSINKRQSILAIAALLFVNLIVVYVYFQTNYVTQSDFSKLD